MIGAVDGIRGPQRGRPDVAQAFDYVRETMFSDSNGDRPGANNYVVLLSGNDRSVNTNRAIQAAQHLKVRWKDQELCFVLYFTIIRACIFGCIKKMKNRMNRWERNQHWCHWAAVSLIIGIAWNFTLFYNHNAVCINGIKKE